MVIPQQPKWHGRLGARAIHLLLSGLASTWRIETDPRFARDLAGPVIFASWHNRLAVAMGFWARIHRAQPELKLGALVSASRDGGLLARTLEHFQVQPVRGSSSRRGPQALREAVSLVNAGYCVAITPDGPRGPKYRVKPGIVALGQLTGRPIVATGAEIRRRWTLKSWDSFQVPLPFSPCRFVMAEPLVVPREAGAEEREKIRLALEGKMLELNPD